MSCHRSALSLLGCAFRCNASEYYGGGIYIDGFSTPSLRDCVFEGNWSGGSGGAAMSFACSSTFSGCTFIDNAAKYYGGGMNCTNRASYPLFDHCTFRGNTAGDWGGGVNCDCVDPVFRSCTFAHNSAVSGGGLRLRNTPAILSDCLFLSNDAEYGGGIDCRLYSSPSLASCTVVGNVAGYGSAVCCNNHSLPGISNAIVAFNVGGEVVFRLNPDSQPILNCSDSYGNEGGDWTGCIGDQLGIDGNFSECPLFCDAENSDFHVQNCSPCAPGNHPDGYDCGLIGAFGVGCECGLPSLVEQTTWSSLKSLYR